MKISDATQFGANPKILERLEKTGIVECTSVQEEAIKKGLCSGKSLVIAAPTSSGKTTIAEIAAVEGALKGKKTIYLVTHKALAEEKYQSFKDKYATGTDKWFDVSISTGDHTEGDWNNGILIATYEKYLSLLSNSTVYSTRGKIVIADEIQIISDIARGPDIEILCTILKINKPSQFIALSATAPNVDEIARWFGCEYLNITYRDVPLRQEVWFSGKCFYAYYGEDEIKEDKKGEIVTEDTLQAVKNLLNKGLRPILVFTMTRKDAIDLATKFSRSRQQSVSSFDLSEQLELFSEPTSLSDSLKTTSERKVAFHSADLSFSERTVVENALRERRLDVVFSTPTLAAGVNFPIRTVIFHSFSRFWDESPWISKSEFLNMSGRAGRLGLDDEGLAILIPKNNIELSKSQEYLSKDLDKLNSTLFNKSTRKSVLSLISSAICGNYQELKTFYSETFGWFQMQEQNSTKLEKVEPLISKSVDWHVEKELIVKNSRNELFPTPLGKSIASTGLLPSTGVFLLKELEKNEDAFSDNDYKLPLLHAICSCDEFLPNIGQRFLPFSFKNQPERIAWEEIGKHNLFINPSTVVNYDRVTNAAYGLYLWSEGNPERQLRHKIPPISYGHLHTLAIDVAWILDGITKISNMPGAKFDPKLAVKLNILADQIRFGVSQDAIDIIKAAQASNVPGLGRQRAMNLVHQGLFKPNDILKADFSVLQPALGTTKRAHALKEAISRYFEKTFEYWKNRHLYQVREDNDDRSLITSSYEALGCDYEDIIKSLLEKFGWNVRKLDTNKRQGVPDIVIEDGSRSILVECKTKQNNEAIINKEDAFAILTKGQDIDADHLVTVGKPDFDTFSQSKAAGSKTVTLVSHYALVEAFIRWRKQRVTSEQVFEWLITPGVAIIDRLPE
jgi:helicase